MSPSRQVSFACCQAVVYHGVEEAVEVSVEACAFDIVKALTQITTVRRKSETCMADLLRCNGSISEHRTSGKPSSVKTPPEVASTPQQKPLIQSWETEVIKLYNEYLAPQH